MGDEEDAEFVVFPEADLLVKFRRVAAQESVKIGFLAIDQEEVGLVSLAGILDDFE